MPVFPYSKALLLGLALTCAAAASSRTYLNVGDPAPALRPAKWLKGTPTVAFEKGKVYVVEFWATWCTPCKQNIPHLTDLAKRYKGKVSINGISIWESNDPASSAYLPKVAAFVKGEGAKMDYNVAVDAPDSRVANAWMKAADESGIPMSFVIGRDGRIAWMGHPSELEAVLASVVAGKFDVAAARERRALQVETIRPIHEAMTAKAYAKVVSLIDTANAKHPEKAGQFAYDRLTALFHADFPKAQGEAETILKDAGDDVGAYRMVGSIFASNKDLSPEAYAYGKAVLDRAVEKKSMEAFFLAMGAEVRSSLGEKEDAAAMQEKAVASAEADPHITPEFVAFLKKNLERFRTEAKATP